MEWAKQNTFSKIVFEGKSDRNLFKLFVDLFNEWIHNIDNDLETLINYFIDKKN